MTSIFFRATTAEALCVHGLSGLSTPVLMWFESYYKPFSVTAGFRILITDKKRDGGSLGFTLSTDSEKSSVIVCLEEGKEYIFNCDAQVTPINKTAYALTFIKAGEYRVEIKEK